MKTLFNLRDRPNTGIVQVANDRLASFRPEYSGRFGAVGSERWWQCYERGELLRIDHIGRIIHVGRTKDDFDETCDIVRIQTDDQVLEYDREDFWLDPLIAVGCRVAIQCVEVKVETSTGPITTIIDVLIQAGCSNT